MLLSDWGSCTFFHLPLSFVLPCSSHLIHVVSDLLLLLFMLHPLFMLVLLLFLLFESFVPILVFVFVFVLVLVGCHVAAFPVADFPKVVVVSPFLYWYFYPLTSIDLVLPLIVVFVPSINFDVIVGLYISLLFILSIVIVISFKFYLSFFPQLLELLEIKFFCKVLTISNL